MEVFLSNALFIAKGILLTGQLLGGGLVIGAVFGLMLAIAQYKGIAAPVVHRTVSIIRGTPLILQLAVIYFVIPGLTGLKLDILAAGIITFGFNSSAYIAEILRAGIDSIPKGQFEASRTLKIPSYYMWKDIIFPQVIKNILPAMLNEIISLLKETAIIATIGGMDIMRSAQTVAAEQFTYFLPLCIAGSYYYGLVLLIEYIGKRIECRMWHAENK